MPALSLWTLQGTSKQGSQNKHHYGEVPSTQCISENFRDKRVCLCIDTCQCVCTSVEREHQHRHVPESCLELYVTCSRYADNHFDCATLQLCINQAMAKTGSHDIDKDCFLKRQHYIKTSCSPTNLQGLKEFSISNLLLFASEFSQETSSKSGSCWMAADTE